ncbi:MAG: Abi family protein [Akkermansia sp.]|nr:Abi family protein [Akkermansia sp.]
MSKIPYDHPFQDYGELTSLLVEKGIFGDVAFICERLKEVGYQRLSAYWITFTDHDGRIPVNFDFVWRIYCFDRKIRALLLEALERIEIAVRNRLVHFFAKEYEAFGYLNRENFPGLSDKDWNVWYQKQINAARYSRSKMVIDFFNKYSDEYLPIWIACELMDFGSTVVFYDGVEQKIQKVTSRSFNIGQPRIMLSWLRSLNDVRNACAHHNRVWNRAWVKQPSIPKKDKAWTVSYNQCSGQWEQVQAPSRKDIKAGFDITKTGIMLTLCQILLMRIDPKNGWKEKLLDVINNPAYSDIKLSMMGLPDKWYKHPLWS